MKVDPFDMFSFGATERMDKFNAGSSFAMIDSSKYRENGSRYGQRCYCEIRYRDRVWCGVSILNPADEYNQYKGWMLATTRAARAVAHEMNFPLETYVALMRRNMHFNALKLGIVQPTAWEKEHYKEFLQNAEGETK